MRRRGGGEEGGGVVGAGAVVRRLDRIRKRGALSSSGGSGAARKLRFRAPAVLLRRRSGAAAMSEASSRTRGRHCRAQAAAAADGARPARRLVGAFWQMDKERLFGEDAAAAAPPPRRSGLLPRSRAPTEASEGHAAAFSQIYRLIWFWWLFDSSNLVSKGSRRSRSKILEADVKGSWHGGGHGHWLSSTDVMSNATAMEIVTCSQDDVSRCPQEKTVNLHDLHNSLIASKELVRVLAHIWGPGELNPSTTSLISALRSEIDLARSHVRKLIKEQKSEGIESLKKQLVQEMESWKSKQKEKVANALQYIVSELDSEKKSRRRAERINKKLGMALANTEASLQAATKELERERKSKGRVEKICTELIRGIGEDKAEVEALKKETEKAQEELQKEREMLQLADEWREQRVQMKLLEARLQFEEKNAAINQLHDELQAYLDTKKEHGQSNDQMTLLRASENGSDMHSIELNVDGNSKSYTWSYTPTSKDRKRNASFSQRGMDSGSSCGFDRKFQETGEELLEGDWAEGCSNGMLNFEHDEERYLAIKNLREQMLAGSGFIVSQGREHAESEFCGL
ncbi:Os04g0382800 [Oryza sativa Japonica Group]|uniref:Os04g0382800 protein n=1 Tax=Oryza sativa subsp. japonica TaxID=39947 RepID=A0A0P0W9W5_ORYSJ|nr:Os04g0382800 [Oryza sativa Japonica Group]